MQDLLESSFDKDFIFIDNFCKVLKINMSDIHIDSDSILPDNDTDNEP